MRRLACLKKRLRCRHRLSKLYFQSSLCSTGTAGNARALVLGEDPGTQIKLAAPGGSSTTSSMAKRLQRHDDPHHWRPRRRPDAQDHGLQQPDPHGHRRCGLDYHPDHPHHLRHHREPPVDRRFLAQGPPWHRLRRPYARRRAQAQVRLEHLLHPRLRHHGR
ncbi:hypothetical protein LP419_36955 [Massilia sp. H-1]|nr:hypothetical protein LP419_36955 [Massilia sp. H-1]